METIIVKGTIQWIDMGAGSWAIVTDDKQTYQLCGETTRLEKKGLKARVEGILRNDMLSMVMAGPILEVKNYEILTES
ncbi:MAG: hypothetical protein AAF152_04455 [Cyanobacteria bacterium P01_A01_bin.114]